MRVGYFIPAYRQECHIEVAMDLARGVAALSGVEVVPFWIDATGIARARNMAVDLAYRHGFDVLLMQDADCFTAGPHSSLERLLDTMSTHRAAVVGAAVAIRNGQGMNCTPAEPGEVHDGDVGTGIMLVDLRKLRLMEHPWFVHRDDPAGLTVVCGEDVYFCRRVRAHGQRVLVDYTFRTGHASTGVVGTLPEEPPVTRTQRGESAESQKATAAAMAGGD